MFFFNDTATTEIYTLSLHDALPICRAKWFSNWSSWQGKTGETSVTLWRSTGRSAASAAAKIGSYLRCPHRDRKSTRLNSSHANISYAVFCLKKKNDTRPGQENSRHL